MRKTGPRLAELDSLRGLAATAVLLFHLTYWRDDCGAHPLSFLALDLRV